MALSRQAALSRAFALAALLVTTTLPAQKKPRGPDVDLNGVGEVARIAQPAHATCATSPFVYYFKLRGSAKDLAAGQQLVLLVNPIMWDGRRINWFTQCMPPVVDRNGHFDAIGQVGSEDIPGGAWFAGQQADVVVVVTTQRPAPGAAFASPESMPGFVAASRVRTLTLAQANTFQVTADCDTAKVSMVAVGVPKLGAKDFGMTVYSSLEGKPVVMLLGEPTYAEVPLLGGVCMLHLGDRPIEAAVGTIVNSQWSMRVEVPMDMSLRGRLYALQSVAIDDMTQIAYSSGAWVISPW